MHRLGVNTTIFARSKKVGVLTSPSLQAIAQTTLSKELDIKFEILPNSIEDTEHGVAVSFIENDETNTILKRFDTYMNTTEPVLNYYSENPKFKEIDGSLEIDEITRKIDTFINV